MVSLHVAITYFEFGCRTKEIENFERTPAVLAAWPAVQIKKFVAVTSGILASVERWSC
jgi:hypothetical protein